MQYLPAIKIKVFALLFGLLLSNPMHAVCSLTVFGNSTKPPKNYIDERGVSVGILVDMMDWIGKDIDCTFTIKLMPWKHAYTLAKNGKGGIIGLSATTERLKIFDYSDAMFYDEMIIVTLKSNAFDYRSIEDLIGKRISIIDGASYGDEYNTYVKDRKFLPVPGKNILDRLKMLLKGQVDIVLMGPGVDALNRAIRNYPYLSKRQDRLTHLKKPFKVDPNYFGIPKTLQRKPLIRRFNQALQKGYANGTFDEINKRYNE